MTRYWDAHSDCDWYDATHGYGAPEPITPEQEKLLAEEQARDMAEIDAERAREERRQALEEVAAALVDSLDTDVHAAAKMIRALIRLTSCSSATARALEEAAQVADALQCDEPDICSDPVHQTARAIAARIRALIDKGAGLDRI